MTYIVPSKVREFNFDARHLKIADELGLPEQEHAHTGLQMNAIERHFYKLQYEVLI